MFKKNYLSYSKRTSRTFSETSPLNPHNLIDEDIVEESSYGSFAPYINFFRNSMRRSSSLQVKNIEKNKLFGKFLYLFCIFVQIRKS